MDNINLQQFEEAINSLQIKNTDVLSGLSFKNILLPKIFKKGGSIHIKKKNKGKFTDYCGGTVTSACILKGKNSSNPITRKRATFADNARHFKHQLGGILKLFNNV